MNASIKNNTMNNNNKTFFKGESNMNTTNAYQNQMDNSLRCPLIEKFFADHGIELEYAKAENRVCENLEDEWALFCNYADEIENCLEKLKVEVQDEDGNRAFSLYDVCHEWDAKFLMDEQNDTKLNKTLDKLNSLLKQLVSFPEDAPDIMKEYLYCLDKYNTYTLGNDNDPQQIFAISPLYLHATEGEDEDPDPAVCPEFPQAMKTYAMLKLMELYIMSGFTYILSASGNVAFDYASVFTSGNTSLEC